MRLLFVADGRSPIAVNWIQHFVGAGHEVHLVSTYPSEPDLKLASLNVIPLAFSGAGSEARAVPVGNQRDPGSFLRRAIPVRLRTAIRQRLGPLTLGSAARRIQDVIETVRPDLVHAMRIPYEGMAAALSLKKNSGTPLLISVWGNDFTLHAPSTPQMRRLTCLALARASALHADCMRDLRLARAWGFDPTRLGVVLPGGGGVQLDIFYPPETSRNHLSRSTSSQKPAEAPTVINPRGFRAYVRNDSFFKAIPLVLEKFSGVRFLCPSMDGEPQARRWVDEFALRDCVDLLPRQSRLQMAELFRRAQVAVSPSTHDGTPNTLLEAMACGCFPVAGDLEPLREWITPGVNGLLVDPLDPACLADAILLALNNPELRARAEKKNLELVAARAEHRSVMRQAEDLYRQLIG